MTHDEALRLRRGADICRLLTVDDRFVALSTGDRQVTRHILCALVVVKGHLLLSDTKRRAAAEQRGLLLRLR